MSKQILLSNGRFALVDDSDFEDLSRWRWSVTDGYARRGNSRSGHILMHAAIIGSPPVGMVTDHINRDRLDNRRSNLRFVSSSLNARNRDASNVYKHRNRWRIYMRISGKLLHFGSFAEKEEAIAVAALLRASLVYYELTKGDQDGLG